MRPQAPPPNSARAKRLRLLLGLLCIVCALGTLLSPILRRRLEVARRIEQQTDELNRAKLRSESAETDRLASLRAEVDRSPSDPQKRLQLAALLAQTRRYKEAEQEAIEASRTAPQLAEPHIALSEIYSSNSLFDLALEQARIAYKLEPRNTRAIARLGYVYVALDWYRAAVDILEPAAREYRNDPVIQTILAQALFQTREYRSALTQVEAARRIDPSNSALIGPLIEIYMQLNLNDDALKSVDSAIAQFPGVPNYHLLRARILRRMGRLADAEAEAREIVKHLPDEITGRYNLALILKEKGDWDGAHTEISAVIARNPGFEQAEIIASQILAQRGDLAGARRLRDQHVKREAENEAMVRTSMKVAANPKDAAAHLRMGKLDTERKNLPRAVTELKEALLLAPQSAEARTLLASALRGMNRAQEAELVEKSR